MSVSLALQMRQHLALTPRLQQSLRLLQLSSLEFQQELRQALDQNPFLEDGHGDEEAAADAPGSWPRPPRPMRHPSPTTLARRMATPRSARGVRSVVDGRAARARHEPPGDDAGGQSPGEWLAAEPSLNQQLHDALRLYPLNRRDREAARLVIDALDDDGYLRQELGELLVAADPRCCSPSRISRSGCGSCRCWTAAWPRARCPSVSCCNSTRFRPARRRSRKRKRSRASISSVWPAARRPRSSGGSAATRRRCRRPARWCAADPRPGNHYGSTRGDYVVPDVIVRQARRVDRDDQPGRAARAAA